MHTEMTIRLSVDHGGDDEVVATFCGFINAAKSELDKRPLVSAVMVSNTTSTVPDIDGGKFGMGVE